MDHQQYLDQCFDLVSGAVKKGDHPFGSVIVLDGKVVASSANEVITLNDVTAHAEIRVIQKAQQVLGSDELSHCLLYTSTEPCPMCAGAIYWAGINKVIFGCSQEQLYSIVGGGLELKAKDVFSAGSRKIQVEDCSDDLRFKEQHEDFWT